MTNERSHPQSASLLWIGLEGQTAAEVPAEPTPGGVVLFGRNLDPDPATGPARCHTLIRDLQKRWGRDLPLAVAIDQEGGRVSRLKPWVGETPTLRRVWTAAGAAGCEAWGRLWGEGLHLLGFNVDFAPVADLYDGIEGTGQGGRCASEDPAETAAAAGAFLHGLETLGVKGCLKHFPGLGGTRLDSHVGLPELLDPAQIERGLLPFRRLAHPDRLIMVAHLRTPWSEGRPASLHHGHVAGNPWGVQGRWISDDLEMGGCADWPWPVRIRLALEAGHQALLVCQNRDSVERTAAIVAELPRETWTPLADAFSGFRRSLPAATTAPFDGAAWKGWLLRLQEAAARLA
jgi:beta-N-acetylhexosaminidase